MRPHHVIWLIASIAVAAALMVVAYRNQQERRYERVVARMLQLLEEDPQARLPGTRQVVNEVVDVAQAQERHTAESLFALGLRLHGQGQLESAEQALRNAVELKPDWAMTHNALGIVLLAKGDANAAEAEFRRAIELDPDWGRPHNDLAILLRLANRLDDAKTHAEKALELDPDSLDAHNNYGNLLVRLRRYEDAAVQYEKALQIDSDHPWPQYNLACLYALLGQKDKAIARLEAAIGHYEPFREEAKLDEDLKSLRGDPRFMALTAEPSQKRLNDGI